MVELGASSATTTHVRCLVDKKHHVCGTVRAIYIRLLSVPFATGKCVEVLSEYMKCCNIDFTVNINSFLYDHLKLPKTVRNKKATLPRRQTWTKTLPRNVLVIRSLLDRLSFILYLKNIYNFFELVSVKVF